MDTFWKWRPGTDSVGRRGQAPGLTIHGASPVDGYSNNDSIERPFPVMWHLGDVGLHLRLAGVDVGECLPGGIDYLEIAGDLLCGPGRREAARHYFGDFRVAITAKVSRIYNHPTTRCRCPE